LVGKSYGNKYRAYFAGLAPISAPRIVVAVMIDEPTGGSHYGGDVAAPVFSTIVSETLRTLNVLPDSNMKQMVLQDGIPSSGQSAGVKVEQVALKR
jgi:cell division protein FtsI (penicillin-binding protein 3)